ncbi:MAG: MmgE/PrpD family protein [Desulfosudaceae bacterium]
MTETTTPMPVTEKIAAFVAETRTADIPVEIYDHARVAFMDWVAVTLSGHDDPLIAKLNKYADTLGGQPQATLIGQGTKKTIADAALINGAASHALDYDDTLVSFLGHPSVTLFPALLALAEWQGKSGRDFLTAYLIGLQAGAAVGACASLDHYLAGWHATSTLGHIAAAAGCARLLGLNQEQTRHALGIGATQSSGLKRVFGTMCKPFHAGRASQSGLMAALLAQDGFTSAADILEGEQGFFQALKGTINNDAIELLGFGWDVVNLSQKYHASCHATHSPLEAALATISKEKLDLDDIAAITVRSSQLALDAAGNPKPRTGLEAKFSIPFCVANALVTGLTGTRAFTDEQVNNPRIQHLMAKITVLPDPEKSGLEATVTIEDTSGRQTENFSDILQEIPPLDLKKARVKEKFIDLCQPLIGESRTAEAVRDIEELVSLNTMTSFAEKF